MDHDWDEHYKNATEQLPWDEGVPSAELVAYFNSLSEKPASALEIGCGTGTNAIWLAEQGCKVVASDLSPTAIAAAIEKGKAAHADVRFVVEDIIDKTSVPDGSVQFAFDRGVFHVIDKEKRAIFAQRVANALSTGGYWLCMAGCADEPRDDPSQGPPQLTASELLQDVEPLFEVRSLERATFTIPTGRQYLAWLALYRKRG